MGSERPFCPACEREFDPDVKFCPHDGTQLIFLTAEEMVRQIFDDRYKILFKLGEGKMGAVYKAEQLRTGKPAW